MPCSVSALSQAWKTLRQLADAFLQLGARPLGLGAPILQPGAPLAPASIALTLRSPRVGVGVQQATHPRRGRLAEGRMGRAESGWAPPQGELGSRPPQQSLQPGTPTPQHGQWEKEKEAGRTRGRGGDESHGIWLRSLAGTSSLGVHGGRGGSPNSSLHKNVGSEKVSSLSTMMGPSEQGWEETPPWDRPRPPLTHTLPPGSDGHVVSSLRPQWPLSFLWPPANPHVL